MGPDVALIAGLMGEPARAAILAALVDGRALPAGELAFIGNVAPQTASFHLRKLMDASLITVQRQGKHSYYRLANERVAATIESIAALAPLRDQVDLRSRTRHESEREKNFASRVPATGFLPACWLWKSTKRSSIADCWLLILRRAIA